MNSEAPPDLERDEKRRWAARQLRLPAADETSSEGASAALLGLLPDEDWVPPERFCTAWSYLQDDFSAPDETTPCDWRDREAALREDVDVLAAEFFDLTGPERAKRLVELDRRAVGFPRHQIWLRHLSQGVRLDLKNVSDPDENVSSLIRMVAELFVMRPSVRAAHWHERLAAMTSNFAAWEKSATLLRRRHPEVAALLPGPIRQLSENRIADQRIVQAQRERNARFKPAAKAAAASVPAKKAASGRNYFWLAWLVIYPLMKLATSGGGCSGSSPRYTPATDYRYMMNDENVKRGMEVLNKRMKKQREAERDMAPNDGPFDPDQDPRPFDSDLKN